MKISKVLAASAALFSWKSHATALFGESPFRLVNSIANTSSNSLASPHFNITAEVEGDNRTLAFVLETNRDLTRKDTRVQYLDIHGNVARDEPFESTYHITKGSVWMKSTAQPWENVGWARMAVLQDGVDPLFEGTFTILSEQYEVKLEQYPSQDLMNDEEYQMVVLRASAATSADHEKLLPHQGCMSTLEPSLDKRQFGWGQSSLVDTIGSTSGCPSSRQIAYIGVATDCSYSSEFNSTDAARRNILNVVNTASVVFENSFNISLGLQNLTISDTECPDSRSESTEWNAPCSSGDLNWRLQRFTSWRSTIDDSNAYWTLMTGCRNSGSAVGVSWVGELCNNGGSSPQSAAGTNVVARTPAEWQVFAHESAHTFGAVHDCDSSTCQANLDDSSQCCPRSTSECDADGEYIMNPSSRLGMTRFSPCTIGNICSRLGRRVSSRCLVSADGEEDRGNGTVVTGSQCGNGVVEPGEACDCGGDSCSDRDARCCDEVTCQWRGGSECERSERGSGSGSGSGNNNGDSLNTWVQEHRPLIIGLSAGIGGSLLLAAAVTVICCCCRGRKVK